VLKKAQRDTEAAEGAAAALRRQAAEGDAGMAAEWEDKVTTAEAQAQELSRRGCTTCIQFTHSA
jgi:hypothetical protein